MIGTSFNDGWEFRPKVNPWLELSGRPEPYLAVTLPHDAMLGAGRDGTNPEGAAIAYFRTGAYEYRKVFVVPEEWRSRSVILRFEGIYRSALVYVNGELAGYRPYGYSELAIQIGGQLRYGEDNAIRVEARTHDDSRWYSGGGIYRNTTLFVTDRVHVALDGVRITTPDIDDDRAVVAVATTVANDSHERRSVEVLTEVLDAAGSVVAGDRAPLTVGPGSVEPVHQRLYVAQPNRWSLDHPHLYTCRTRVLDGEEVLDKDHNSFGIRSLQVDPTHGLRINGETVNLRGACIHHDNGILGAATITRADERRVELLKAAGFNAIRSAHNPISRALLDACDRVGMVVMDEAFDAWTQAKRDFDYAVEFPTWWEQDLGAMVAKDFNHPSVLFYSIGNEILELGKAIGARLSRAMAERVRALDGTRFVTNGVNALLAVQEDLAAMMGGAVLGTGASEGAEVGVNTALSKFRDELPRLMRSELVTEKTRESFAALDVAGYNYLESRYELDAELFPNRVIVGTETAINFIADNWRLVEAHGHLIGDFAWTGWDYLGEVGIGRLQREGDDAGSVGDALMAPYPWLAAWCGDIDITGRRRPASYFREIAFGLRRDPYITVQRPGAGRVTQIGPWTWSDAEPAWTWEGHEDKPVTVEVYADADEVELLVNGAAVGRVATGEANGFRGELTTPYTPGEIVAVSYRAGKESGRASLRTAAGDLRLAVDVDRAELAADHHDLAFVTITLVDAAGTVHPHADRSVRVRVDGAGVLQGLGSAEPVTEEGFLSGRHRTFQGRALAAIRPTGAGSISVTVDTDGCEPVTVAITAR